MAKKPGQFIKGDPRINREGRPEGAKSFTTKVTEALEKIAEGKEYTYEEALIKSILKKAIVDGDTTMIRLIWNYKDGMPVQKLVGDDESPLVVKVINYARDNNSTSISTSNISVRVPTSTSTLQNRSVEQEEWQIQDLTKRTNTKDAVS